MDRRNFLKYVAGAIASTAFSQTAEASPMGFRVIPAMLQMTTRVTGEPAYKHLKEGIEEKLAIPEDSRLHLALKGGADFVNSSKDAGITPEFVYAGSLSEGLDAFIDRYPELNPKMVDGFHYLGLQTFGEYAQMLRINGYLPEDFREGRKFEIVDRINEKAEPVKSGTFKTFEDAMLAVAAEYAWRRDTLKEDLPALSIPGDKMNQQDLDFWNFAYYIGGSGGGKNMLRTYAKKGILEKSDYIWNPPRSDFSQIHYYARERMASLQVMYSIGKPTNS